MTTPNSVPMSADEWFQKGRRVLYDPIQKKIVPGSSNTTSSRHNHKKNKSSVVAVFELSVYEEEEAESLSGDDNRRWMTILPGFPDGSYGFHKVEHLLKTYQNSSSAISSRTPRLYIEYVGQGDSDKPQKYKYSTMERADLVQAQWKAHGIQNTVLVSFDYSSLVVLELLQRQREREEKQGMPCRTTTIEHVLAINGGYFADGHSHPITTTPLLTTPLVGPMGAWMAQQSNLAFDIMLKPLFSKEYRVTKRELRETESAIRRHKGAHFLASAAGFVQEHQRKPNATRWNLESIYKDYAHTKGISFHLVGSEQDPFEHKQIDLTYQRLGMYQPSEVRIERIPGGHLSTSEQAETLVKMMDLLVSRQATKARSLI